MHVVLKCSRCSRSARQELDDIVSSQVFLVCGQFGFTRPIQDYGSGPGTPLATNRDGLGRGMVAISAKS